jgi:hypothetical protein
MVAPRSVTCDVSYPSQFPETCAFTGDAASSVGVMSPPLRVDVRYGLHL